MSARKKGGTGEMQKNETIIQQPMEEVMHNSMIPYAEYVIMERAIPRVEDGLKPVQRRILYTMYELGLVPEKPHRKSARIVGDTLGKYHPHGDTSVYDAMVRMAQDFNMRELLVDGHGNFGSIDGDSAAAMRYTEARLTPLAMEMLRDLEKETVHFSLNFDDTLKEPDMLPGRFPNLLVNGASGIAVGLATNIPPHNLKEVIDGIIAQIDRPDIELKTLMRYIKGPDFPTGGIIVGMDEIVKAYATGRGKLILRARIDMENIAGGKKLLVIKELPYQVNKANALEKILKLSEEKKGVLSGIADIRDESDRNGMRAVIELKKDAEVDKILNHLYKYSDLQITFGVNMVAIADGKPLLMGLKEMIDYYIRHQKNVVIRRTTFDLEKAKARLHILEGLMLAVISIDKVIAIIKSSKSPKEAKGKLINAFSFSDVQAQAVLDMRLQRLTGLEILALEKEYHEIRKQIAKYEGILASEKKLMDVIKKELLEIKKKYGNPRKTALLEEDTDNEDTAKEDYVVIEDGYIALSHQGFIKRIPSKSFNRSNHNVENIEMEEGDYLEHLVETSTDHRVLMFTNQANCYQVACSEIPKGKWREKGVPVATLVKGLEKDERVVAMISVKDFHDDIYLNFYTKHGMIKRSSLSLYHTRNTRIQACKLRKGDEILNVEQMEEDTSILLVTKKGMSIHLENNQIRSMGRVTAGVKAMMLMPDDYIIFARQISQEGEIVLISDDGYGKRILASDFNVQRRGGKGNRVFESEKDGSTVKTCMIAYYVKEPFDIILSFTDGESLKISTEDLPIQEHTSPGKSIAVVRADRMIQQVYRNFN
ncbi:MAG: DNA gyrase subunit A [Clostridia bacterium]|jgi:DNA gyrase subunit A